MPEQRLDHRKIQACLRQGGAEACAAARAGARPERRRGPGGSGRSCAARPAQPLAAMRSLPDHKQRAGLGVWPFGEQVGLNPAGHLGINRCASFAPAPPATRAQPAAMSTSTTSSARTSLPRSPENSISPAIALSRHVR